MFHPGIRIKELRLKRKMSQVDLAQKLGMNRENISHYERGKITKIPSDVLAKIADVLHTNTDFLLGRSDNPNSPNNTENKTDNNVEMFYFERDDLTDEDIQYIKETIEILKERAARRKRN